jgi:hypothetical protein
MKMVPSGYLLCCMKGAFALGGGVIVGMLNCFGSFGRPPPLPVLVASPLLLVRVTETAVVCETFGSPVFGVAVVWAVVWAAVREVVLGRGVLLAGVLLLSLLF